jgi:hypothetical protein
VTQRQYFFALVKWLIAYAALLEVSLRLLNRATIGPWLVPLTVLPMLPAFGLLAAVMKRYRGLDELQQRIMSEGILFAFGCTAILTLSYGFLENTARVPVLSYFWVWPIMATSWIGGNLFATRRYR